MELSLTNEQDIMLMKLLNYFITKKNYSPIVIRGVDNEIWLENPNEEYRIIRIVTKNIYNDEQYKFDVLKTKQITKQIKRRTLSLKMNVLSLLTKTGDNFSNNLENDNLYSWIIVKNEDDLLNNEILNKHYKDLKNNLNYEEEGFELISRITNDISKKNIEESEKRRDMLKTTKPIISYVLISLNILIFILMYIFGNGSESSETLINFGANYIPLTKSGEYFRLISSAFLHIGVFHILFNMYALYILGPQIESYYGKMKFIIIYLYSAILGSLFTTALSSSNTVAAGASGAIFGLLGSLLYFGYQYRGYIGDVIIKQVMPIIIINLFIGFTTPGIGNMAHIGGLIGGYFISMAFGALDETKTQKINGFIVTTILTIFMIYISFIK